jgi:tetratricopeptide (TPR) repeat protein
MVNVEELLQQAHSFFSVKKYDKALFVYSQVLSNEPKNKEYKTYCLLCDFAMEESDKAQDLFDYFIVSKDEDMDKAIQYVEDFINAHDGDNEKMMGLLQEISNSNVEALDAIEYRDFMELVETRGSFKEAYQDIMFSTKVAITTKEELVDFINNLIDNNFNKTAYSYLDGFNEYFLFDEELVKLYEKLGSKKLDIKTQQ